MAAIWEHSATAMARSIARRELTSEEVVGAHVARCSSVNPALNAIVVPRFEAALGEARAADARLARGEALGALHGVPMTVKESIDLRGLPSTFGLPSRADDRAAGDDPYVTALREAGAIVIGKTNVPQLLIYIESDNPLYGRTNNPWDVRRTCGGSSGGEAAIIAAGGVPLGLGNDIGGSLRAPAAFCGIASLKPTQGRFDDRSRLRIYAGQTAIVSQMGPLARDTADLAAAYALLRGTPGSGRREAPAGGNGDVRNLRIGYYEHAGALRSSRAVARAVREAAAAALLAGAAVVPFDPPSVDDALDLFFGVLAADGGRGAKEALGDDPRDGRVAELLNVASQRRTTLALLEALLRLTGQRGNARLIRNYGHTDTYHYWSLVAAIDAYRAAFARALDAAPGGPLDALLCPPGALPALPHGASADVVTAGAYAPLYNVLGYPAGTLPFTRVAVVETSGREASLDRIERAARRVDFGSAGLPVAVQIVARPWREDIVLALMQALETAARSQPGYPRTPVDPG